MPRLRIVFLLFLGLLSPGIGLCQSDEVRWVRHIESLLDVAVHTENDPKFLDWAEVYCDSLKQIEGFETLAAEQQARINQTRDICGDNLNHRAPSLEMFRGKPSYMGFADDAVEYALESAMLNLLGRPIEFQSTTLVRDGALNALVVQQDVAVDLWEIALDALDVETNYNFRRVMGSPKTALDSLVWSIQTAPSDSNLSALAESLNVSRLALFEVEELDVVEDRLWVVGMRMHLWDMDSGLGNTISAQGFCEDKTGSPILWNLLDILLWSVLFLVAIAGLEHMHWSSLKSAKMKWPSILRLPLVWVKLAGERIPKTFLFLVLPAVTAFLFIQAVGSFVPGPTTHYQELEAKLWVIGTAIGMSLLPTVLNFFVLNRFRLDGFHSLRSYRDLANVSLYGSYLPFIYIHEVNGTPLGIEFVLMLVVATWMAADLLAFNLHELLSSHEQQRVRLTAGAGLLVGVGVVVVLTFDTIGEAAIQTSLQLSIIGGLANVAWRPAMRWAHRLDSISKLATSENTKLESGAFVSSVVPQLKDVISRIQSNEFIAGYVSGPKGIGKTRLVEEIQRQLRTTDEPWTLFYGDCDEIQDEGHLAFEPFVEAFGTFLKITEVGDRTAQLDAIGQSVFSAVTDAAPLPLELEGVEHDAKQSLVDFALHLVERLEKVEGNMMLVLDDLHWMDSDSKRLLEKFWGMVSRSPKLYGRVKLVLVYREADESAVDRINAQEFQLLISQLEAEDLLCDASFNVEDFLLGLSSHREDFTLSESSLARLNGLFNDLLRSDAMGEPQVVTPLYILRSIAQFKDDETLVPGSDGWVLSRSLVMDDMPNSEAIDAYYHNKFRVFPAQWMRVLESASIVGRNFDATVLSAVWGHELLDVLDFLEQLEAQDILVDVREEDNVYRFKDKRAVTAVRSYFPNSSGDRNARQIVIEYNKRLLSAESTTVPERALRTTHELWSHLERLGHVRGVEDREFHMMLLIEELAIRAALDAEELGTSSIVKLEEKAIGWGFIAAANLLRVLVDVLGEDSPQAKRGVLSLNTDINAALPYLDAYVKLLFDRQHAVQLLEGEALMLTEEKREAIAAHVLEHGQGAAWVGVVALLRAHPLSTREFKVSSLAEWKKKPPVLSEQMRFAQKRFELESKAVGEDNLAELEKAWEAHWDEVCAGGSTRQRKVVAKAILRRFLNGEEDIQGAVDWFLTNERHLRSNSGALQLGWIQTLNGVLLKDVYARRMLCLEHKSLLQTWFIDMERHLELRFEPSFYSQSIFDMRSRRLSCEMEWKDLTKEELQERGEAMVAYVKGFPDIHTSHLGAAYNVAAKVSLPETARCYLEAEHAIYTSLHNETPQAGPLGSVCARLSMLCRNQLKDHEAALLWARESLSWAEQKLQQGRIVETGTNHYFVGAALVELDLHQEAAEAFQQALDQWKPDSDGMKYKIAITNMHRGASQIKAGMPEGKQTLQEAIDALESQELKPLVSNTNASRIEEMKKLLD